MISQLLNIFFIGLLCYGAAVGIFTLLSMFLIIYKLGKYKG